jgi:hypothetical protein
MEWAPLPHKVNLHIFNGPLSSSPVSALFSLPALIPGPVEEFLNNITTPNIIVQQPVRAPKKSPKLVVTGGRRDSHENEIQLASVTQTLGTILNEYKEEKLRKVSLANSRHRDCGENYDGRKFLRDVGFLEELASFVLLVKVPEQRREDGVGPREKKPPRRPEPELLTAQATDTPQQLELKYKVKNSMQWLQHCVNHINKCIRAAYDYRRYCTGLLPMDYKKKSQCLKTLQAMKFAGTLPYLSDADLESDSKVEEWVIQASSFRKHLWKQHRHLIRDLRLALQVLEMKKGNFPSF